jgi:hypothetical protein
VEDLELRSIHSADANQLDELAPQKRIFEDAIYGAVAIVRSQHLLV